MLGYEHCRVKNRCHGIKYFIFSAITSTLDTAMELLHVLLCLLIFIALWLNLPKVLYSYYRMCKLIKPIPGWPTHWLYGNLHQLDNSGETLRTATKWMQDTKYPIIRHWFGPFLPLLLVNHPDIVKELLKIPKAKAAYNIIEPWLGQGLLVAHGNRWARNRRLLTKAFHFDILKPYVQVINECTDIFLKKLSHHASTNEPVLVYSTISQLTLDILLRCAFSFKSQCQEIDSPYFKAISDLCEVCGIRMFSPFLLVINNFIFFNFTPQGRRYRKAMNLVHRHAEEVIKERKKVLGLSGNVDNMDMNKVLENAKRGRKYLDFLDILLTACDDSGCGLTDLEIRYEVDTFMFEGHDTTATAMSWTLYCLAKYPEHQEKCREEIKAVMEGKDHFEYEDLPKLSYTFWCIKEALRLYPPVISSVRKFDEDTKLGDYLIPKQAWLSIQIYQIHHNPEFWENPDTFDPLRFHPDKISCRHPYAYLPFSAGPRNCIGQNFAFNEERVVIASVLRKFKIKLVEGHHVDMCMDLLLKPKGEIKLLLENVID